MSDLHGRDLADYGTARLADHLFDAVRVLWRQRQAEGWTYDRVAKVIDRSPDWVRTHLSGPGYWTLRVAGELIVALEGEAEIRISSISG